MLPTVDAPRNVLIEDEGRCRKKEPNRPSHDRRHQHAERCGLAPAHGDIAANEKADFPQEESGEQSS